MVTNVVIQNEPRPEAGWTVYVGGLIEHRAATVHEAEIAAARLTKGYRPVAVFVVACNHRILRAYCPIDP